MTPQTEATSILDLPTITERAILYARVSSDDRGKDNLQGQLELCREYVTGKGYTIVEELKEDDRGASGYEIDLPQLTKIRELALAGQIDVVIVRELDRLSRNLAKQLIVEEELRRAGVRIEFVLAEYADTPEGRLQKHIRATIAEYERELIKIRMNRGKRRKIEDRGHVSIGDRPPFGYTTKVVDDFNGVVNLEIDPDEAQVITLIYDLFLVEGLTVNGVTTRLSDLKILSPADRRPVPGFTKKRPPGNWSRSSVQKILTEPTYTGTWNYGRRREKRNGAPDLIPVPVPVIIPAETFEMAQDKLNRNKGRRGAPAKGRFLLSKRMTCIECGSKMSVATWTEGDNITYSYYYCPGHAQRKIITGCNQKYLRQEKMDSLLWNWIESILSDRDLLERELNNIEQRRNSAEVMLKNQVDAAAAKLAELETDLNNTLAILKTLKPGSRSYAVVLEDVNRLEDAITKVAYQHKQGVAELSAKQLQPEVKSRLLDYAEKLAAGLEEAKEDYELQKAIVAALDVETRLGREDGEIVCCATCFLYDYEVELTTSPKERGQKLLIRVPLHARLTL